MLAFGSLLGVIEGGTPVAWLGLVFFGLSGILFAWQSLADFGVVTFPLGRSARPSHRVMVSAEGVTNRHPNGTEEHVGWDALQMVGLRSDDAYPVGWTYWILVGQDETGCVVPIEAEGSDALLQALQERLPGFDNDAVIEAMGLLDGGKVVWRRGSRTPDQLD